MQLLYIKASQQNEMMIGQYKYSCQKSGILTQSYQKMLKHTLRQVKKGTHVREDRNVTVALIGPGSILGN